MVVQAEKSLGQGPHAGGWQNRKPPVRVSTERMSALIGSICECVLDPTKWGSVLDAICREFSFAGSMLGVLRVNTGAIAIEANAGFAPEWVARGAHLASYLAARSPIEPALPSIYVAALTLVSGIYDLAPIRKSSLQPEIGLTPDEVAQWSPIGAVHAASVRRIVLIGEKETPPFFA